MTEAVERMHDVRATWLGSEHVTDSWDGTIVLEREIQRFEIVGHPKATIAFGWSEPVEPAPRRRFFAVIAVAPVLTALDAVRASIVADARR